MLSRLRHGFLFEGSRTLQEICPEAAGEKNVNITKSIGVGKYGTIYLGELKENSTKEDVGKHLSTDAASTFSSQFTSVNSDDKERKTEELKSESLKSKGKKGKIGRTLSRKSLFSRSSKKDQINKELVAVKKIRIGKPGSRTDPEAIKEEIDILRDLQDCPFIVKYHHAFTNYFPHQEVCIVLEYVPLGDCRKLLQVPMSRLQFRSFAASVLLSLRYMHRLGYVHRDIKPENFLLVDRMIQGYDSEYTLVKLCDFGATEKLGEHERMRPWYGTLQYLSPEFFAYSQSTDLDEDEWTELNNPDFLRPLCTEKMDSWGLGLMLLEVFASVDAGHDMTGSTMKDILASLFRCKGKESAGNLIFFRKEKKKSDDALQSKSDDNNLTFSQSQPDRLYSAQHLERGFFKPHKDILKKKNAVVLDFISKCLILNPKKRLSVEELCKHKLVADIIEKVSFEMESLEV